MHGWIEASVENDKVLPIFGKNICEMWLMKLFSETNISVTQKTYYSQCKQMREAKFESRPRGGFSQQETKMLHQRASKNLGFRDSTLMQVTMRNLSTGKKLTDKSHLEIF